MSGPVDVLVRIPRRVWESMGGVNNPALIVRSARRGPDRYYLRRARVQGGAA